MTDAPKRQSRVGLFGPLVAVAIIAAGWSAYWVYTAHLVEGALKSQQAGLIAQGYQVKVDPYKVTGYPFRIEADLSHLSIIAPTGRGVEFPKLEAAANAYALDKWVMTAPQGLTFHRGGDLGTLAINGTVLRTSASGVSKPVPNIAIEGLGVSLVPSDPARPFTFDSAQKVEAYLRPNAAVAGNADALLRVTGAHGQTGRFVGNFSPGKPLDMHIEATLTQVAAFSGHDFGTGLKAWKAKGAVTGFKSELKNGDLRVMATSDGLTFDGEGRVVGRLNTEMTGTFKPLDVLAAAGLLSNENLTMAAPLLNMTLATVGAQKLAIDFREGGAFIGPLKVSDAPLVP